MTTAAIANGSKRRSESQHQRAALANLGSAAANTIGNLLPTASLQQLTQRKYTLPDKTVASQVLMYRQLLHTKCRPGLRLSRPYQATAAQKAVLHMPWWEQGIEDSGKMVISYDNLIVRLWMNGAVVPFEDLLGKDIETMIDEKGLPPIPHEYWVDRLGFQQPDPVTDFRSGGVLSLAMMVHMVESCLPTVRRIHASVLPFGITCINVTDMMAKFLMLAKSVDRMEALMSQKPFWRMFADPNAILAVHEIAMNMMCDVVEEMNREKAIRHEKDDQEEDKSSSHPMGDSDQVTVFDFPEILEKTERRVRDDLLGAGPSTVDELKSIAGRLRLKYLAQLEAKEKRATELPRQQQIQKVTGQVVSSIVGNVGKIKLPTKLPTKLPFAGRGEKKTVAETTTTTTTTESAGNEKESAAEKEPEKDSSDQGSEKESEKGSEMDSVVSSVGQFSIDDDDEDLY